MTIYFFETDRDTKVVKAGIKHNGKREIVPVCAKDNKCYVVAGDQSKHEFNAAQDAAFLAFMISGALDVEFFPCGR